MPGEDRDQADLKKMETLSLMRLSGGTLRGYCPGERLCQFFAPGKTEKLDGIAFQEGYIDLLPKKFAEQADQVIIDWMKRETSSEAAKSRLDQVIQDLRQFSEQQKDEDTRDMCDLCITSLIRIRDETFGKEAELLFAEKWLGALQHSLGTKKGRL